MNTADREQLEVKGEALKRGALIASEGDIGEAIRRIALALAWLTSPSKELRDAAKKRVREWLKAGEGVSQAKP